MRILGLDVGTSSVKAAVFDLADGSFVGPIGRIAYPLDHPTPDAAEIPAERLWHAVASAAREATRAIEGIEAIGLSCLTPALVILDRHDRPLLPIWTHLDRRARSAARQTWAAVGLEFLETVGNRPLPGGISVICWRQQLEQDPYLRREVKSYLHVNGWLGHFLTGERVFDRGNACFSGLYGTLTDQQWSSHWCEYFEVDPGWLPPVVSGSTTIGTLRSAVATELGLPGGLQVKIGTADTSSAMLAAGMTEGDLLHVVGTTQVLASLTSAPRPSVDHLTRQLGVGDQFIHVAHNPVGGVALDWVRELCFRDQTVEEFYGLTVPAAEKRVTRVTLGPPYLGGDRLEIEAQRAALRDLTLSTDRLDIVAAILQAMVRGHHAALAALGLGEKFDRVFLTGGGAEVVRRLIPAYTGTSIQLLEEGSLRGIARLFQS